MERSFGLDFQEVKSHDFSLPNEPAGSPTLRLHGFSHFFYSVGVLSPDIAKILSRGPWVLWSSLENQIMPAFNFFKSFVGTVENVVIGLKRQNSLINCETQNGARNIAILRENRVPESNIVRLLTYYPKTITSKNGRFKQKVEEIKKMGFDLSKFPFMIALYVFTSVNKLTWKLKLEAYRRWDFSEDEILMAFRKYPSFMTASEKKITSHMDFFVNKMGWEREVIITRRQLLALSLEKRILPRCSVLQVLILKGLVKENLKMVHLLIKSEKHFFENFVIIYEKEVPHLLDLYKGNTSLLGLGDGIEERDVIILDLNGPTAIDWGIVLKSLSLVTSILEYMNHVQDGSNQKPCNANSAVKKAEDVVSSMLAKGFVLGKDALNKARTFDERHHLTSNASVTVLSLDRRMGLREKITIGTTLVNEKMRLVDERFQVSEKTRSAIALAEQKASSTGSALMEYRYISGGASWVSSALSMVAKAAEDLSQMMKDKVEKAEEEKKESISRQSTGILNNYAHIHLDEPPRGEPPVPVHAADEGKLGII
ncbi:uncharacterized protein LOC122645341 [Telopea speciosissima]|uniref:uncharacterized protein LOC122645341 n=1 Tax=Telopea speciosissima TaxID=54955 RepID=UPI001CC4E3EE|nr:uncharacterized protein LOC122645341 [Telopea speciosissima]